MIVEDWGDSGVILLVRPKMNHEKFGRLFAVRIPFSKKKVRAWG